MITDATISLRGQPVPLYVPGQVKCGLFAKLEIDQTTGEVALEFVDGVGQHVFIKGSGVINYTYHVPEPDLRMVLRKVKRVMLKHLGRLWHRFDCLTPEGVTVNVEEE